MTTEASNSKSSPGPKRNVRVAAAALAVAALSFGAGGVVFSQDARMHAGSVPRQTYPLTQLPEEGLRTVAAVTARPGPAAPPRLLEQGSPFSFADLVEHVSPAVVTVSVQRETSRPEQSGLDNIPAPFRDFFREFGDQGQGRGGQGGQGANPRQPRTFRSQAMGSGFIIDPTGYIVTNNHVVEEGSKISVKLPSGREYEAKLIGADKDTDVALIKIDGVTDLPIVALGDDRRLRVGDWVVAVGNPFGLGGTVTAGIVSSIGRDIGNGPYTDYIQLDAPINQGNSGGPTFDLSGRVIGMNTAIFSPSGGSVGIGFAIPASTVKAIVDQLKDHGNVDRGWLGVQIQSLTPDMAASMGAANAKGAIIANVVDASPAAKAGFRQGDVVVSMNGADVDDSRDLTRKVAALRAGEKAEFAVLREGQRRAISATIAKRDDQQVASVARPATPNRGNGTNRQTSTTSLGLELMALSTETREKFSIEGDVNGVVVSSVDPNSEAAEKGFRPGDVIMSVGNKPARAPADIEQGVADAKKAGRETVLLLVAGEQGQRFVALKVAQG